MNNRAQTVIAVFSAGILAACGGGGGGGSVVAPAAPNAISATLGTDPVATRANVSRHSDGRIMLEMTEGTMRGMTLLCQDQTLGTCKVVGGATGTDPTGRLISRMSGAYAYVGNFEVLIKDGASSKPSNQIVFANLPEQSNITTSLPNNVLDYTGEFVGGFGLVNGDSGQLTGTTTLLANFDTGRISGDVSGRTQMGNAVSGSFNNLVIDPVTKSFAATDATTIRFQQQQAWGDINGSFYGPNAEEAAGVFNFGNGAGGMNGMFLACKGPNPNCITQ